MSTQYLVALELGYDRKRIKRALAKKKFACAGDLIEFLEDNEDEQEEEEEEEEEEVKIQASGVSKDEEMKIDGRESKIEAIEITEDAEVVRSEKPTLLQETEQLYRRSLCLQCRLRCKSVLCLPCCHLSMCKVCGRLTKHCPTCGECIHDIIVTYLP